MSSGSVTKHKQKKIIDELRQIPENRKCFDCGENAPTYVNMTIGTFVCQSCSGVLREVQHRVKGLGVSEFTKKELELLQNNGNKRAAVIWREKWDPKKNPRPSNENRGKLKQFMEHTYVEKLWKSDSTTPATNKTWSSKSSSKPSRPADDEDDDDDDDDDEDDEEDANNAARHDAAAAATKASTSASKMASPATTKEAAKSKPSKSKDAASSAGASPKPPTVDLLSFDDIAVVSSGGNYKDPWQLMQEEQARNAAAAATASAFPPVAGFPAAAAPAAANPFGVASAQIAAVPGAAPVNPFLAAFGAAAAPSAPPANPFAAAPVPIAAPSAPAFNPFLDFGAPTPAKTPAVASTPSSTSRPMASSRPNTANDEQLARELQSQLIAEERKAQEDADRLYAMRLQQQGARNGGVMDLFK